MVGVGLTQPDFDQYFEQTGRCPAEALKQLCRIDPEQNISSIDGE